MNLWFFLNISFFCVVQVFAVTVRIETGYVTLAVNANTLEIVKNHSYPMCLCGNQRDCIRGNLSKQCAAKWIYSTKTDIISFQLSSTSNSTQRKCHMNCVYSATINDTFTTFNINRTLTLLDNNTEIMFDNPFGGTTSFNISLQYCSVTDMNSPFMLDKLPINASYRTTSNLTCTGADKKYPYFNGRFLMNVQTTCNETAKWTNTSGIRCWSAPAITLDHGNRCDYKEYDYANFTCFFAPDGYPGNYSHSLYVNNKMFEEGLINMTYLLNNAVVECRANTQFPGSELIKSKNCTLNITYGPKFSDVSTCEFPSRQTITDSLNNASLTFRLTANPFPEKDSAWIERIFPAVNRSSQTIHSVGVSELQGNTREYQFELDVENGTELKLCASYIFRNDSLCTPYTVSVSSVCDSQTSAITVSSSHTVPTSSQSYLVAIIASSATVGGVGLLAAIGLLCVLKKRRQNKANENSDQQYAVTSFNGTEKEDVINPLYGTSSSSTNQKLEQQAQNNSGYEKEEKVNPVYQSMSSPISEETYAQVDKRNKPKDKKGKQTTPGVTNDAFTNETPLYAVVEKKEKPSTSGGVGKAVLQADSVYSEVKKNKIKQSKKEDDKDDLHGSSKKKE